MFNFLKRLVSLRQTLCPIGFDQGIGQVTGLPGIGARANDFDDVAISNFMNNGYVAHKFIDIYQVGAMLDGQLMAGLALADVE